MEMKFGNHCQLLLIQSVWPQYAKRAILTRFVTSLGLPELGREKELLYEENLNQYQLTHFVTLIKSIPPIRFLNA